MYEDKTLTCCDCGNEFIFSASEQEFYAEKGFQNEPRRCKACRDARKAQNGNGGAPVGGSTYTPEAYSTPSFNSASSASFEEIPSDDSLPF